MLAMIEKERERERERDRDKPKEKDRGIYIYIYTIYLYIIHIYIVLLTDKDSSLYNKRLRYIDVPTAWSRSRPLRRRSADG